MKAEQKIINRLIQLELNEHEKINHLEIKPQDDEVKDQIYRIK